MGVTECDNMLMLLAVSTKMTEKERDVVVPLMMRGFKVCKPLCGHQSNPHPVWYFYETHLANAQGNCLTRCSTNLITGLRHRSWIHGDRRANCHEPLVHHRWGGYHSLSAKRVYHPRLCRRRWRTGPHQTLGNTGKNLSLSNGPNHTWAITSILSNVFKVTWEKE